MDNLKEKNYDEKAIFLADMKRIEQYRISAQKTIAEFPFYILFDGILVRNIYFKSLTL